MTTLSNVSWSIVSSGSRCFSTESLGLEGWGLGLGLGLGLGTSGLVNIPGSAIWKLPN